MGCRAVLATLLLAAATAGEIPSPSAFLGREVGSDRYLAPWPEVVRYFQALAAASDRVALASMGRSTLGNDMPLAIITSPTNHAQLDRLMDIARRLANPDRLAPGEAEQLIAEGKPIVLVTCTIHATEVAATQMALLLAHQLATTEDPRIRGWLEAVVLLLAPSINPDGQIMVVDWYNRYLGTPYEGGPMPWLYHHYAGHDNNRDFYMLALAESRAVNDVVYHRFYPQVFLDLHQMGSLGPRMVVPPQTDPLAPEVHPLVFRMADLFGTAMALRLEEAGHTGVGSNMIFDSYWPGGTRNTAWWKNVVGLLAEVASARIATPIYVDPGELRGGGKGFPSYQRRANFPSPWPGGWWRLRDIIAYQRVATLALLESVATHASDVLRNFHRMGAEAVARGAAQPPFAFLIPPDQHDPVAAELLVELLLRHGIRVGRSETTLRAGRLVLPPGTFVVPAAQPYREFLMTMLRPQRYPEVGDTQDGSILPPYDATSWSLPIAMGVEVVEAVTPVKGEIAPLSSLPPVVAEVAESSGGYLLPHAADTTPTAMNRVLKAGGKVYWLTDPPAGGAPGDVWIPPGGAARAQLASSAAALRLRPLTLAVRPSGRALRLASPRIGLYQPWTTSMDEGWTRLLLDRYEFNHRPLHNDDVRRGRLADVDVIVLPDLSAATIGDGAREGRSGETMPPEYRGGLGREGGEALQRWVEGGGWLVAVNAASEYAIQLFGLPVSNALAGVGRERFSAPGTSLRVLLDSEHPLSWGMRAEEVIFVDDSPAFLTRLPEPGRSRHVVARYPEDRRDILVSGYLKGEELLARRAAAVEVGVGKGKVLLLGFKPANRAQTHRTFKLLFNALYLAVATPVELDSGGQ
jgi:hypothetical protein